MIIRTPSAPRIWGTVPPRWPGCGGRTARGHGLVVAPWLTGQGACPQSHGGHALGGRYQPGRAPSTYLAGPVPKAAPKAVSGLIHLLYPDTSALHLMALSRLLSVLCSEGEYVARSPVCEHSVSLSRKQMVLSATVHLMTDRHEVMHSIMKQVTERTNDLAVDSHSKCSNQAVTQSEQIRGCHTR